MLKRRCWCINREKSDASTFTGHERTARLEAELRALRNELRNELNSVAQSYAVPGAETSQQKPASDTVRIVRVLEYVGPRAALEKVLSQNVVKGYQAFGDVMIREAIVGQGFPEVVK